MRGSVLLVAAGLVVSPAISAADDRPWLARFQAGSSTIHEWGRNGAWFEGRVGRSFAGGVLSADLGLAVSSSDEGYGSLAAGFEVLPFPRAVVSPFARAEVGVLGEPEYGGYVADIGGGLGVRLNDRLSLRGGATWGLHGDVEGPVVYYGGLQVRW